MSVAMIVASALSALTFGIHVWMGGPEIHRPIQGSSLSTGLRAISAVLWHAVTVVLAVMAGATAWLVVADEPGLAWTLIAICVGWAGLFVWYGWSRLGSLKPMPQWVIFLALAGLIGVGM